MGKEFELKYAATDEQLATIQTSLPGEYKTLSMATTYYDTPDADLSARGWTLRRRLQNGVSICTLKIPAEGHGRHEWELESDTIESAIPQLCKRSTLPILAELTCGGVVPVCGARFTRQVCLLDLGDATVELALDTGTLFGGSRELSFAEVEVELKSGREEDAIVYAQTLAARFALKPEKKSKFCRALALAKGE